MIRLAAFFYLIFLSNCVSHGHTLMPFEDLLEVTDHIIYGELTIDRNDVVSIKRGDSRKFNNYFFGRIEFAGELSAYKGNWTARGSIKERNVRVLIPSYKAENFEKMNSKIWLLTYNSLFSAYDIYPVDLDIYDIEVLRDFQSNLERKNGG